MPPARKKGRGVISSAVKTAVPLWMGLGPAAVAGTPVAAAVGAARVARRVGKKLIGRGVWDKVKTGLKIAGTVAGHVLLPPKKTRYYFGPDGLEEEESYDWNDAGWKARQERSMRQRMRENERKWYAEDKMSGSGFWDKAKKVAKVALPAAAVAGMTYLGAKEGKHAWDTRKAVHAMRKRNFDNGNISIHDVADFVGDGLRKRGGSRRQRGGALPAFLLPAVPYFTAAAGKVAAGAAWTWATYKFTMKVNAILYALQSLVGMLDYDKSDWLPYLKMRLKQMFTTHFFIDRPLEAIMHQVAQRAAAGAPPGKQKQVEKAITDSAKKVEQDI
jgi:hypothetical protein